MTHFQLCRLCQSGRAPPMLARQAEALKSKFLQEILCPVSLLRQTGSGLVGRGVAEGDLIAGLDGAAGVHQAAPALYADLNKKNCQSSMFTIIVSFLLYLFFFTYHLLFKTLFHEKRQGKGNSYSFIVPCSDIHSLLKK